MKFPEFNNSNNENDKEQIVNNIAQKMETSVVNAFIGFQIENPENFNQLLRRFNIAIKPQIAKLKEREIILMLSNIDKVMSKATGKLFKETLVFTQIPNNNPNGITADNFIESCATYVIRCLAQHSGERLRELRNRRLKETTTHNIRISSSEHVHEILDK